MKTRIPFALSSPPQKKVAVISHERSGTHFLMNTLALNFNYVSGPWWNLDSDLGLNLNSPQAMFAYLQQAHNMPISNILKSHHAASFFGDIIDYLLDQFHILYICRDPRNVMTSFWKHINELQWNAGPKTGTVGEFIRCAPRGGVLRYQKNQEINMLTRWSTHVNGWVDLAGATANRIKVIHYEDLDSDYEKTIRDIGAYLCQTVKEVKRPDRNTNVIGAGKSESSSYQDILTRADMEFFLEQVGTTMSRLGY